MDGVEGASQPDDLVFRIGLVMPVLLWPGDGGLRRKATKMWQKNDARTKKTKNTFQDPNRKSPSSIFGAFLVERVVRGAIPEVNFVAFPVKNHLKSNPKSRFEKTVKS